jgi:hypothetical protein
MYDNRHHERLTKSRQKREKIMYSLLLKLTSIGFILLSLSYIFFLFFSLLENNVLLLNKKSIEYKDILHAIKNIFILLLLKSFFSFSLSRNFLNNFPSSFSLTIFFFIRHRIREIFA